MIKITEYLSRAIKWDPTGDAEFPYDAMIEGNSLRIRVNDFPADNLYTLIAADAEFDLDEWPSIWAKATKKKAPKSNGFPHGPMVKAI